MIEDVGVRASGVLKSIGQNGQAIEGFLPVDANRKSMDGGGEPAGIESNGAEGVADNLKNQFMGKPVIAGLIK